MKERICYIVAVAALTLIVISLLYLGNSLLYGGSVLSYVLEIGGIQLGELILKAVGLYEW